MDKYLPASLGLIGRVGLGALLLALFLAPILGGSPSGALYGEDIALNAIRALVCVGALCLFVDGGFPGSPAEPSARVVRIAAGTLAGLTTLSLLVHSRFLTSPILLFAMLPATLDVACAVLVMLLCARLARDVSGRRLLVATLALSAIWVAISGVREYGQNVQNHLSGQRISATFFDPNFAAGFLALSLPLVVAGALIIRERLGALALGTGASLILAALAATGSRAGIGIALAGLFVAFVAALAFGLAKRIPWVRVGVLLVAFAALAFACRGPLTARVGSDAASAGQEHSGSFRVWTWKGTLAMAKANPLLGTGPGTFPYRYGRYAIVAKTDLAHSTYFQLAGEEGFPALVCAAVVLAAAFVGGIAALARSRATETEDALASRLLLCGLLGALVAGAARSVFDSEGALLGNALPLWAVVGLVSSVTVAPVVPGASPEKSRLSWVGVISAAFALLFSLLQLRSAQAVDAAQTQIRNKQPVEATSVWPPDPNLLYWSRQPEEAARIEPSSRRFFQWARVLERQNGDTASAIPLYARATEQDPNNLQAWRALAEAREKAGDANGAIAAWNGLVRHFEGPAGQVRAIPELPETYPAFAYAALAKAAARTGDKTAQQANDEKAARVVESYSRTTPVYQQMELAGALLNNVDVLARRAEIRGLYEAVMRDWIALSPSEGRDVLQKREQETLARLDAFAPPSAENGTMP